MNARNAVVRGWVMAGMVVGFVTAGLGAKAPQSRRGAGDVGAGFMLGSPMGGSLKSWTTSRQAIDAGVGASFGSGVTIVADYLWHDFSLFEFQDKPDFSGKLPFYLGLGGRVRTAGDKNVGIRGMVGVSYLIPRKPFEIFAELVPVLVLSNDVGTDVDGAIGLRYYFKR